MILSILRVLQIVTSSVEDASKRDSKACKLTFSRSGGIELVYHCSQFLVTHVLTQLTSNSSQVPQAYRTGTAILET